MRIAPTHVRVEKLPARIMPDEQPQRCVVWVDYDGAHVRLYATLER